MSSVKNQRYKANQNRKNYSTKQKKQGVGVFNPPPCNLIKEEILVVCLEDATSSFGLAENQSKIDEALNTSWFGFNQDDLLLCINKLIHLEKQKINEDSKKTYSIFGKEIPVPSL